MNKKNFIEKYDPDFLADLIDELKEGNNDNKKE